MALAGKNLARASKLSSPFNRCIATSGYRLAAPNHASHGGLPPKQEDHYMYPMLKKHGANFFPNNPDYHWLPYYGGASAPTWEFPKDNPTVGWAGHVGAEVDNALRNCGIDLPVFGIIDVQGPKASEFLGRACTKTCSKKYGDIRLAYTCNKDGVMWNDVSLNTRAENDIYFIGLAGFGKYELDQLEEIRSTLGYSETDVTLTNRSYDQQLFHVFGPKAPKILAEVLGQEVVDVPYFKFRDVNVKGMDIQVYHMSYAAVPGYELHCSKDVAPQLYDMLLSHPMSKAEGFKPCGVMGIQSLRTEVWFRGTPDVKGVAHYAEGLIEKSIRKNHEFWGYNAEYKKEKQVVMLTVDTPRDYEWSLFGAQHPIFSNGKQVGHTLHSAFGGRSQKTHAWAVVNLGEDGAGNKLVIHAHDKEMPAVQLGAPIVESTFRTD